MADGPTDEDLAWLVQKGDQQALSALMDRYTGKLLRYGGRFLASNDGIADVVQNVFVSAYENIRSNGNKIFRTLMRLGGSLPGYTV